MTWKMTFRGSDNSVKGLMLEKSFFLAMYTKGKGQEYMDFLTFALNGWWTEYIDIFQKKCVPLLQSLLHKILKYALQYD